MFNRFLMGSLCDPNPGAGGGGASPTPAPAAPPVVHASNAAAVTPPPATPAPAAAPAAPAEPRYESVYDRYFASQVPADPAAEPVADSEAAAAARGAEALVNKLSSIESAIEQLRAGGNHTAAAAVEAKVKTFVEHLQAGDMAGAEAALTAKLSAELLPRAISEATRKAITVANAQSDLAAFGQRLLTENPDLAPVQDLIEQNSQYLVSKLRAEGRIPDGDLTAYVEAYKSALRHSIERFRNFNRGSAATGAQNAASRQTEVLRAGGIPPSTQSNSASPQGANPNDPPRSPGDQQASDRAYIQARMARKAALQGMGSV